jgi:flagellar operon protein
MSGGPFMYPNVTSLPGQSAVAPSERQPKKPDGTKGEFDQAFEHAVKKQQQPKADPADAKSDLTKTREPLKFSAHASQRLHDRKIAMDPAMMSRVNDAVDKAAAKGVEDTLVLTPDAALIVSVKNRTVITALDRGSLSGNVFTNIDGAVIV